MEDDNKSRDDLLSELQELRRQRDELRLRVKKTDQLQLASTLLMSAIQQVPAGVLVATAPDVRIVLANDFALGIRGGDRASLTEIPGDQHPQTWQTFHPDGRPYEMAELPLTRAVLEGETCTDVELIIRREDGEDRWVLGTSAPVRNENGKIIGGVVVFPDITDRRAAEREQQELQLQLQHTQKLESLGVLAGGIAHDFNNLLTGILGNAGYVLNSLAPSNPASRAVEDIQLASERAAALTGQMLAYSGKSILSPRPIQLSEHVREISHLIDASVPKKVQLRLDLDDDLPAINADPSHIQQVVMNLVINGAEAITDPEGTVLVTTGVQTLDETYVDQLPVRHDLTPGDYVFMEVHDTGTGISEEARRKIFDPFFTTKKSGRGLGLAAVLGIVQSHGGALNVYSTLGKGTTFKVVFPVSDQQPVVEEPDTDILDAPAKPLEILVIDDEDVIRGLMLRVLKSQGHTVEVAEDGLEGLELYRQDPDRFDLVMVDMTMPVMDGEEACRELRKIRPDIQLVLMSGYNEVEATRRFVNKGLAGFLQKPFSVKQLLTIVAAGTS